MRPWRLMVGCLILLGSNPFRCESQTSYFRQYTISDGLPTNLVYDVFQDSDGYIWFGTEVGVSRFDGRHFVNYSIRDGLTDNEVFSIFEDAQKRLWFLTFNGKICFFSNGRIHHPGNTPFLQELHFTDSVIDVLENDQGLISFLSSQQGIKTLHPDNSITVNDIAAEDGIQSIWYDQSGRLHQLSNEILMIDAEKKGIDPAERSGSFLMKSDDSEDARYVSFYKSVNIFSKKDRHHEKHSFDFLTSGIIRIHVDDTYYWLGTDDGIFRIRRDDSSYIHLLKGKKVSGILHDDEGNYWFSTLGHGVFFSPNLEVLSISKDDGLFDSRINDLEFDADHVLWIATNNDGVAQYKNGQIQSWQLTGQVNNKTTRIKFIKAESFILNKAYIYHIKDGIQRAIYQNGSDIHLDKYNRLWVATRSVRVFDYDKLLKYTSEEWSKELAPEMLYNQRTLAMVDVLTVRVNVIATDQQDNVYIGGTSGLYKIISSPNLAIQDTVHLIPEDIIHMEYDLEQNTFWVASKTNGVYAMQDDKIIHNITAEEGLSATSCHAIKIENPNTIWIGTIRGLNRIDIDDEGNISVRDFSYVTGIGSTKINTIEVDSINLYLGTDEGLNIIPKSELFRSHHPPKILPVQVYIEGNQVMDNGAKYHHDQNDVSITFNGLSYTDYGRLSYEYRLLGADDDWHTTILTEAKYPKLPSGHYQFEVRAVSTAGLHSNDTSTFSFVIGIPFWATTLFKALAIALIFLVLLLIYLNRIGQIKLRHSYETKLVKTENEKLELERKNSEQRLIALRAQMNPHFLFNVLNTIKGYYAVGQNRKANMLISKFASLLRLILDYSDQSIPLDKEIHLIQSYLELSHLRHVDAFTYSVDIDEDLDSSNIAIPSMLIQPLIENAIIHGVLPKGGNGNIKVHIQNKKEYILVSVIDNGIGFTHNSPHSNLHTDKKSKGLSIVKEQLNRLSQKNNINKPYSFKELVASDGQVAGTEAIIKLPKKIIW